MPKNTQQKGNVLFIILLCVALFAALSYAVTGSTRSTGGDASKENNTLLAAQMVQYASSIENAMVRLRLSNNCTDTQISFENATVSGYTNNNAPTDNRCHIFSPQGGNIPYQPIPQGARVGAMSPYYFFPNNVCVSGVGTGALGTGCQSDGTNDTDLIIAAFITADVCSRINSALGLSLTTDAGSTFNPQESDKFTGTYSEYYSISNFAANSNVMPSIACVTSQSSPGYYVFYNVLIPR